MAPACAPRARRHRPGPAAPGPRTGRRRHSPILDHATMQLINGQGQPSFSCSALSTCTVVLSVHSDHIMSQHSHTGTSQPQPNIIIETAQPSAHVHVCSACQSCVSAHARVRVRASAVHTAAPHVILPILQIVTDMQVNLPVTAMVISDSCRRLGSRRHAYLP